MAKGPIRVLELVVTTSPGGGPRHVWDLARHLPKDEFELVIGARATGSSSIASVSSASRSSSFPGGGSARATSSSPGGRSRNSASRSCTRTARGRVSTVARWRGGCGFPRFTPFTGCTTRATARSPGASIWPWSAGCRAGAAASSASLAPGTSRASVSGSFGRSRASSSSTAWTSTMRGGPCSSHRYAGRVSGSPPKTW